jgi:hypothetical protein
MATSDVREKRRAEVAEVLSEANEVLAPAMPIPGGVDDELSAAHSSVGAAEQVVSQSEQVVSQSGVEVEPLAAATVQADIARETVLFSCNTDPVLALLMSTRVKDEEQRKAEVRLTIVCG